MFSLQIQLFDIHNNRNNQDYNQLIVKEKDSMRLIRLKKTYYISGDLLLTIDIACSKYESHTKEDKVLQMLVFT